MSDNETWGLIKMPSINALNMIESNEGCFLIKGNITLQKSVDLYYLGHDMINQCSSSIVFDCSKMIEVHTIILSVFVAWVRHGKMMRKSVSFMHLPKKMSMMLSLCNLHLNSDLMQEEHTEADHA